MNLILQLKYFSHLKPVEKTIWVMNHFLTMECYRKLCNNLYWKKLQPGTIPYTTRLWMIILTVFTSVWLAFFFDPIDPANSRSYDRFVVSIKKLVNNIISQISDIFNASNKVVVYIKHVLQDNILNIENIFLWRTEKVYIRTTSFLI